MPELDNNDLDDMPIRTVLERHGLCVLDNHYPAAFEFELSVRLPLHGRRRRLLYV